MRADADASFVEGFDGDFVAFADFAEDVFFRDFAAVENQFGRRTGANAELVFFFADREALERQLDAALLALEEALSSLKIGIDAFDKVVNQHWLALIGLFVVAVVLVLVLVRQRDTTTELRNAAIEPARFTASSACRGFGSSG